MPFQVHVKESESFELPDFLQDIAEITRIAIVSRSNFNNLVFIIFVFLPLLALLLNFIICKPYLTPSLCVPANDRSQGIASVLKFKCRYSVNLIILQLYKVSRFLAAVLYCNHIRMPAWPTVRTGKLLLKEDKYKDVLIESLRFLVSEKRITLFAFVIMSNHIHLTCLPAGRYGSLLGNLRQITYSTVYCLILLIKLKMICSKIIHRFYLILKWRQKTEITSFGKEILWVLIYIMKPYLFRNLIIYTGTR